MIVDANILLYSVDEDSRFHASAQAWMVEALNGPVRIGIPWPSVWAFVRISTSARVLDRALTPAEAWRCVDGWLQAPASWLPEPSPRHGDILRRLCIDHDVRGALLTDAVLAAMAFEHGVPIVSADNDFARFPEIAWINPLAT